LIQTDDAKAQGIRANPRQKSGLRRKASASSKKNAWSSAQGGLQQAISKGGFSMFSLSRIQQLKFAAAVVVVIVCTLGTPARANELAQNLGPGGACEPILTTVGNQRVIAFYEPDNGRCGLNAVVYDKTDAY